MNQRTTFKKIHVLNNLGQIAETYRLDSRGNLLTKFKRQKRRPVNELIRQIEENSEEASSPNVESPKEDNQSPVSSPLSTSSENDHAINPSSQVSDDTEIDLIFDFVQDDAAAYIEELMFPEPADSHDYQVL